MGRGTGEYREQYVLLTTSVITYCTESKTSKFFEMPDALSTTKCHFSPLILGKQRYCITELVEHLSLSPFSIFCLDYVLLL